MHRSKTSCVYREYLMEGITAHYDRQHSGRTWVLNDNDQRCLARIVCGNLKATLTQIRRSVQGSLASIGYGSRRPTMTLDTAPDLS